MSSKLIFSLLLCFLIRPTFAQIQAELDKLEDDIWKIAEFLLIQDSLFVTGYTQAGEAYMTYSESERQDHFLKAAKYFKALMYNSQEGSSVCLDMISDLNRWSKCTQSTGRLSELESYYRQMWIASREIYSKYNRFGGPSDYTNYMKTHKELFLDYRTVYGDIMSTILMDLDDCFDLDYE